MPDDDARALELVIALAAGLRQSAVAVGTGEVIAATQALAAVSPADSRAALRAVLCSSRADLDRFDRLEAREERKRQAQSPSEMRTGAPATDASSTQHVDGEDHEPVTWSDVELLRDRDFATLDDRELEALREAFVRLARRVPRRRTRRAVASRRRTDHLDVQRTLRAALRHGGEPVDRRWQKPGRSVRPLVLVLDVSGSMAPYARTLLAYVQAMVAAGSRAEAFALGTRLTRITHELHGSDPAAATDRAQRAVMDWASGTRIGAGLAILTRRYGGRLGRGAVVVLLSDGWDRGDPEIVAREAQRLHRVAHRVVWLNPLKSRPGYRPLARGMAAALPHVDHFLSGNTLKALEDLGDLLDADGTDR